MKLILINFLQCILCCLSSPILKYPKKFNKKYETSFSILLELRVGMALNCVNQKSWRHSGMAQEIKESQDPRISQFILVLFYTNCKNNHFRARKGLMKGLISPMVTLPSLTKKSLISNLTTESYFVREYTSIYYLTYLFTPSTQRSIHPNNWTTYSKETFLFFTKHTFVCGGRFFALSQSKKLS